MATLFESGIRPVVDAYLLEESKKLRDYGSYWSASSAGYCMRKVIFERLGVPKIESDADARKTRVFESGKIFHEWIQAITKQTGLSIAQELELQDEDLMIRGHIDDLVLIDEAPNWQMDRMENDGSLTENTGQHLILYDYKTVNSQSFKYKKDKMSHYWKMQLGTYMYMLRMGGSVVQNDETKLAEYSTENLTEARILAISKDDLRMAETQLMWDFELEGEVLKYWRTLNKFWKEKKMPPCTCADQEGGFMAGEKWNPYYYDGEPCSLKYYKEWKEKQNELSNM